MDEESRRHRHPLAVAVSILCHMAGHVLDGHTGVASVVICQPVVVRGEHAPAHPHVHSAMLIADAQQSRHNYCSARDKARLCPLPHSGKVFNMLFAASKVTEGFSHAHR